MGRFTVDVYADTVCPWCYIGKKSLDEAIEKHRARHPEDEFQLNWRPYILFPNAKVSGIPTRAAILTLNLFSQAYHKKDSFRIKFGSMSDSVLERMARAGAAYDLKFQWDGRTGSSRDSHKLILLAADQDAAASLSTTDTMIMTTTSSSSDNAPPTSPPAEEEEAMDMDMNIDATDEAPQPNHSTTTSSREQRQRDPKIGASKKQAALIYAILDGGLTKGHDISSRSFLLPIALSHGLAASEAELVAYLDSEAANARVDAEAARARRDVGVAAVPSYVVNGRYRIGGMQEPEVFLGLFERIRGD